MQGRHGTQLEKRRRLWGGEIWVHQVSGDQVRGGEDERMANKGAHFDNKVERSFDLRK